MCVQFLSLFILVFHLAIACVLSFTNYICVSGNPDPTEQKLRLLTCPPPSNGSGLPDYFMQVKRKSYIYGKILFMTIVIVRN